MRYGEDLVVGAEGDPVYSAVPFAYEAGLEGVRVPPGIGLPDLYVLNLRAQPEIPSDSHERVIRVVGRAALAVEELARGVRGEICDARHCLREDVVNEVGAQQVHILIGEVGLRELDFTSEIASDQTPDLESERPAISRRPCIKPVPRHEDIETGRPPVRKARWDTCGRRAESGLDQNQGSGP